VQRSSTDAAAVERAFWLAELAAAVNEAQRLAWTFGVASENRLAMELYAQLETIRLEIEDLRLKRKPPLRKGFNPNWML
jgi:hypothetical protein